MPDTTQGKKLFSMTPEQKAKFRHEPSPDPQRGWSHVGAEVTSKLQERNYANGSKGEILKDEKVSLSSTLSQSLW